MTDRSTATAVLADIDRDGAYFYAHLTRPQARAFAKAYGLNV